MPKPPPLTKYQTNKLAVLEPRLKLCVRSANLDLAKQITAEIQLLLRPTGHEVRLLQSKNWLFETAMEANSILFAKLGFEGVMKKSSEGTRLNLEATSLLAICYLREKNLIKARELIIKAIRNIGNIKSDERRKQFHKRLIERLEEESILVGLQTEGEAPLDISKVNQEAINLIMSKNEDQILIEMGKAVPKDSIDILKEVRDTYQLNLPKPDVKFLPPPLTEETKLELGKRASSALKRVAWRAICNPESEVYKAWSQGLSVVYDKKYIAGAIVTSFSSFSISATMIAASAVALAIKFGVEVFCETFVPSGLMIDKKEKP
ncbi:hypothetical protein [Pseudomonas sp. S3E17]|uniref:hypothetical protein n=1 Tax=Pseudomonas sp. S3E17 TaxID=2817893 RepID=UPI0020A102C3|nr:hypothetical protein [Pseudomonas sp. S3E17]MCP1466578.1 hypothetical protein [Pseudomonas sp. S3E17]